MMELPTCPMCENKTDFFVMRQVNISAEDSARPKIPTPPGAGITHPAFEMVTMRAVIMICKNCGNWFCDPKGFVRS